MVDTIVGFGCVVLGIIGTFWIFVTERKRNAGTVVCPECGRYYHHTSRTDGLDWLYSHHCNHGVSL